MKESAKPALDLKDKVVLTTPSWIDLSHATPLDAANALGIRVCMGAGVIDEIRKRYEQENTIKVEALSESAASSSSGEEQFRFRQELSKHREFIDRCRSSLQDQDIFISNIVALSDTGIAGVPDEEDSSKYVFALGPNGRLVVIVDPHTSSLSLEVEGVVKDSFTVLLNKRTESGKIMEGHNDVLQFDNGILVLYVTSTGCISALKDKERYVRESMKSTLSLMPGAERMETAVAESPAIEPVTVAPDVKEAVKSPAIEPVTVAAPIKEEAVITKPQIETKVTAPEPSSSAEVAAATSEEGAYAGMELSPITKKYLEDQKKKAAIKPITTQGPT